MGGLSGICCSDCPTGWEWLAATVMARPLRGGRERVQLAAERPAVDSH